MKIDKQNGNVKYCDESHTYWDDNGKYISVTTLIGEFCQPFDKDFWSKYKALEKLLSKEEFKMEKKVLLDTKKFDLGYLMDMYNFTELDFNKAQQDILDEWQKENMKSCDRGTKIHAEMEAMFVPKKDTELKKFGLGGKFKVNTNATLMENNINILDVEKGVFPEYLVYRNSDDGKFKLAGQIDLLIKDGNDIIIVDYKGLPLDTPIPTEYGFKTMGDLQVGDRVFDKDGNLCSVIHKSQVHNNPCYEITFDNSETIIADEDHRWLINIRTTNKKSPYKELIMTTAELAAYIDSVKDDWNSYTIPKILNPKPLNLEQKNLPIDPYVLGCWLGDGSKQCGAITNVSNNIWDEIQRRGYELGEDISAEDRSEAHTVLGIHKYLRELNLLHNKHIPDIYLRSSFDQRLDLLRGLMDTDGYYHPKRKRFVMNTDFEWQKDGMVKLLGSLGIKVTVFDIVTKLNGKEFPGWSINFSTKDLNPFLSRNQDIEFPSIDKCSFRNIVSVNMCPTVETQCIEVDSPSHTYVFGKSHIVTHNTNKKLDDKSFFDSKTKKNVMMKYPLNNLMDCNKVHYALQLSTYAWMLQMINPRFNIKKLILIHHDHNGNITEHEVNYMKDEVVRMCKWYKKQKMLKELEEKRKPIVF